VVALSACGFRLPNKAIRFRTILSSAVRRGRIEHVSEQLGTATDVELLAAVVELEAELTRLQYRQLAVLAELNSRNVPGTLGFRGLRDLIAARLRCTSSEARKRAQAVERFGARRSLTGEPLDPIFPATADALADGLIGSDHAAAIAETVEAIPAQDRAEHATSVETTLLEHARTHDWGSGFWPTWIRTGRARRSSGSSRPTGVSR
jgi:hypothetical protein